MSLQPFSEDELAAIKADVDEDGPDDPTAEMVGRLLANIERSRAVVAVASELADEAARAVTEPRRFRDNDDGRQQRLGGLVARTRIAIRALDHLP